MGQRYVDRRTMNVQHDKEVQIPKDTRPNLCERYKGELAKGELVYINEKRLNTFPRMHTNTHTAN